MLVVENKPSPPTSSQENSYVCELHTQEECNGAEILEQLGV